MDLRQAISDTIKYADYFHYPLSHQEIHYWLTTSRVILFDTIKPLFPPDLSKTQKKLRFSLSRTSEQKLTHAQELVPVLKFVPGLRMIALSGSVAAGNAHPTDDIDLFFITSPYCLWLVRPLVVLLISLFFRRRHPGEDHSMTADAFCPNLWLDTLSISIPDNKRNLYTAHEVLQTIPLLDRGDTYRTFLFENRWTKRYLANAYTTLTHSVIARKRPACRQAGATWQSIPLLLIFAPLNYLFFLIQLLYMNPKKTSEVVHLHAAFLHTTDFAGAISHHLKAS
ncbi:MAG: hypothetical protein UW41_C0007G0024 [Candidatus Collierbacteria bacterium GW2011_GWC2_44_18]|uniref:Polymerase nucleotidyl transferase domain-containing protein n=2 Tax=Microgenomates group TaxID=1794810 RepID=A0A0G1M6K2_9BACT|nr:MAG: hypothetical protein UW16_C0019G0005 [Microgenomates group bacterium GW2011_GWC1_44_10]KKT49393.1 MAG: hypothetical protein UW41_C0007G0024 [Candidatus Collierbacteria bacterium GW2011_GWC2_44_18]KKT67539.1 MAG: hypothetical protein UW60_C0004G0005 [Candidatus Woesebacteria bacterium GW2011_GWA2_44_33]